MKFTNWLTLATLILFSVSAHALTGNEYNKLSDNDRTIWLIGVADGLITADLISSKSQPPLVKCLAELEWEQIRAIFEKNLKENPEKWNFPAAFSFRQTFNKHCNI